MGFIRDLAARFQNFYSRRDEASAIAGHSKYYRYGTTFLRKSEQLRRRIHQVEYIDRNRRQLAAYLSGRACIDCGNSNPTVLEFDHVRGTKRLEVSSMAQAGYSWKRILEEIAKCDIRCANCHRIKTAAQ